MPDKLQLSKAKTKPKSYAPAIVRGLGAFAPGGLPGAALGGGTELVAQLLEGRFNIPQIGAQAGLGAVPFGKARGLIKSMGKGTVLGGGGNAITSIAEGEMPNVQDVAISSALGGIGGGIAGSLAGRLKLSKANKPPISKVVEHETVYRGGNIKGKEGASFWTTDKGEAIGYASLAKRPEDRILHVGKIPKGKYPADNKTTGGNVPESWKDIQRAVSNDDIEKVFIKDGEPISVPAQVTKGEKGYAEWIKFRDAHIPEAKESKLKKDLRRTPQVKLPIIMSKEGSSTGRSIMSEIEKGPKVILKQEPELEVKTPKDEGHSFTEYANIPKAFSASGDISFPLRQGIALIGRKEWWKSWKPMLSSLGSEESYHNLQKSLAANPKFNEAVGRGLALTDFVKGTLPKGISPEAIKQLAKQEEQFASRVAEQLTGGKFSPIRASNRAYTAFANNLRMSLYEKLSNDIDIKKIEGADLVKKNVADYINSASGRGSMGLRIGEKSETLERGAELLNTVFWSPRFLASRVQLLNPASYTKLDPFTRKQALRDIVSATSAGLGVLGLANLAGAEVELDPTSSDFAKAKIGDTRVDLTGGFSPIIRFVSQAIDGLANISADEVTGPDPFRFGRSKLSPIGSLIADLSQGKDYLGRKIDSPSEIGQRVGKTFAPMIGQDLYELYKEDPTLLPLGAFSATGGSVQVYDSAKKSKGGVSIKRPKIKLSKAR